MNEYTFPFDTCEKAYETGIAQPYSALLNFINCLVILHYLFGAKNNYTYILILSIFLFEAFHLFSHVIHIRGNIQIAVTHMLSYLINVSFVYFFYSFTGIFLNAYYLFCLFLLITFDIYAFIHYSIVYYLISQSLIFITILHYYYNLSILSIFKSCVRKICILILVIIVLFMNEKYNCDKMLNYDDRIPYHILIEIAGIYFFYIICSNFVNISNYKLPNIE